MAFTKTTTLNKNITTKKVIAGITRAVKESSEAAYLSSGSTLLQTEQEIRNTKRASVLLPLLIGIKDMSDVITQAKAGSITLSEADINEFIVELANDKITEPTILRRKDFEVLGKEGVMNAYSSSLSITAKVAKDRAYYSSIIKGVQDGITPAVGAAGKIQGKIVDSKLTATSVKDKAFEFANLIRSERAELKKVKDRLTQTNFKNNEFAIILNSGLEVNLENDARYNMYTEGAVAKNGALASSANFQIDGVFDGTPVIVSKQLPADVDFIIMLRGIAVSIFALLEEMSLDVIPNTANQLLGLAMAFQEGTGVFLPQMITFGSQDQTKYPVQARITFDEFALTMADSETKSNNS